MIVNHNDECIRDLEDELVRLKRRVAQLEKLCDRIKPDPTYDYRANMVDGRG